MLSKMPQKRCDSLPKGCKKKRDTRWYCAQESVYSMQETYPALWLALEKHGETERYVDSTVENEVWLGS